MPDSVEGICPVSADQSEIYPQRRKHVCGTVPERGWGRVAEPRHGTIASYEKLAVRRS